MRPPEATAFGGRASVARLIAQALTDPAAPVVVAGSLPSFTARFVPA